MRAGPAAGALLLLLLPALPTGARAEVFLSPGLEAGGGYTSNRFQEPDARGSAFTHLTPSLELTAFLPGGTELFARARYDRTDFVEASFGHVQDLGAEAGGAFPLGSLSAALALSVGVYRDQALPEDDARRLSFAPGLSWAAGRGVSLSLGGSATASRYDSRETVDGDPQRELRAELHPGVLWVPAQGWRLWAEGYGERGWSNEPIEEYRGAGGAAGADVLVGTRVRVGGWARLGVREYLADADGDGESRRDTPFSAGAWAALRLAPWVELTAEASRVRYRSTEDASDYTAWSVEGGVRFVYDGEVGSP